MKKCFVLAFAVFAFTASAQVTVYDSTPAVLPGNLPSQGYQCCQTAELGDEIRLQPGTARVAAYVTVIMSDWAKHSDYPSMPAEGYVHPITLNIYGSATAARAHSPLYKVTQNILVPWRPEADPTCPGGTAWRSTVDNNCYNGFVFPATFDFRTAGPGGTSVALPEQFIYGVEYDTNTWGYHPIGLPGPYESLNVALNNISPPSVGTDVEPDAVYWNTKFAAWYADGGVSGVGVFRRDTNWAPYVPAVQFTTVGFPAVSNDCKNGLWKMVVRRDFTPFTNQGDCVSYVQNGK